MDFFKTQYLIEVGFSALVFLYAWAVIGGLFKPFFQALEKREKGTSGAEEESRKLKTQTAELTASYESDVQAERLKGMSLRDEIVATSREESKKIIGKANSDAEGKLDAGRGDIQKAADEALKQVEEQSAVVAKQIVDKVLTVSESRTIH